MLDVLVGSIALASSEVECCLATALVDAAAAAVGWLAELAELAAGLRVASTA